MNKIVCFKIKDSISSLSFHFQDWENSAQIWAQKRCEKQLSITCAGTKHDASNTTSCHIVQYHHQLGTSRALRIPGELHCWVPRQPRCPPGHLKLGWVEGKQGLTAKEHHHDGGELLKARVWSHVAKTDACQRRENEIHTRDVSRLQEAGENESC